MRPRTPINSTDLIRKDADLSAEEIDQYLATLDEPKRSTLNSLRETILGLIPEAEQGLSYAVPAFRVDGKLIAGFSAAKNHLSYLPHSGDVLSKLDAAELQGLEASKGALRFPVDAPPPEALVARLIAERFAEINR